MCVYTVPVKFGHLLIQLNTHMVQYNILHCALYFSIIYCTLIILHCCLMAAGTKEQLQCCRVAPEGTE